MPSELVASGHGIPALRCNGGPNRTRSVVLVALLTAVFLGLGSQPAPAADSEADLRQRQRELDAERERLGEELGGVEAERDRLSDALGEATATVGRLTGELHALHDRIGEIEQEVTALEGAAATSREHLAHRVGALYRGSAPNEFLGLLAGTSAPDLADRSHYLAALTRVDRSELETAAAVGKRLAVRRADLVEATARQDALAEQAKTAQEELNRQLAAAGDAAEGVRAGIAARAEESLRIAGELDERREASARAMRAAEERRIAARAPSRSASRPGAPAAAPTPVPVPVPDPVPDPLPDPAAPAPSPGGGTACPQDNPRSFTDTWGAPRSGGRSHKGTDVFGAMGGAVFAITDGTIEWTRSGSSAGLWLSLRADDGDRYWYMHLSGFVAPEGARVRAGELIARNGNTGNARGGSPHIHFEHHPGGGRPVNPYPLLRRACG